MTLMLACRSMLNAQPVAYYCSIAAVIEDWRVMDTKTCTCRRLAAAGWALGLPVPALIGRMAPVTFADFRRVASDVLLSFSHRPTSQPRCTCLFLSDAAVPQAGRLGWPVSVLLGHTAPVTFVDFCRAVPDALLSSSFDGTCRVWDARAGGAALHVLRASPGFALDLSFRPSSEEAGPAAREAGGLGRRLGSAGGAGPSRVGEGGATGSGLGSPWATGVPPWGNPSARPAGPLTEAAAGSPRQIAPADVPGPAGRGSGPPGELAGPAPGAPDGSGAGPAAALEERAGGAGGAGADDAAPANVRPEQKPTDLAPCYLLRHIAWFPPG